MQQNGNRNGEKSSYNENYSPHHPFTDVRRYSGAAADFVGIFVGIWEFSHKNSNLYFNKITHEIDASSGTKFPFQIAHAVLETQKARFYRAFLLPEIRHS